MKHIAIILALLIILTACSSTSEQTSSSADNNAVPSDSQSTLSGEQSTAAEPTGTGKIIIGIKDKAVGLTDISSIKLTITSIMLHKQSGWETLNTREKEFDLLDLNAKGLTGLFAEEDIPAGNYDMVQINAAKVEVTQAEEIKNAVLPSKTIKIKANFVVEDGKTSSVVLDFIASESLHKTGTGRIIFSPVIQLEIKKNAQTSMSGNNVAINAGDITASKKVGMDVNGNVDVGLSINPTADLSYENNKVLLKKDSVVTEARLGSTASTAEEDTNTTVGVGETYGLQRRLGEDYTAPKSTVCTLRSGGSNCAK